MTKVFEAAKPLRNRDDVDWRDGDRKTGKIFKVSLVIVSVATGFAVWFLLARAFDSQVVFPGPSATVKAFEDLAARGDLWSDSLVTLTRVLAGFAIASLGAIPLGVLMGWSPIIGTAFEPLVEFFRFIPAISIITFAILWFGIGETSKVVLIAFTTFFLVVINTQAGVRAIPTDRIRGARSLGASRADELRLVVLPSVVGYITTGMQIAMGRSFATIVAAEMLAAHSGLGYLIWSNSTYLRTSYVFVGLFMLGIVGLVSSYLFGAFSKYVSDRYTGVA